MTFTVDTFIVCSKRSVACTYNLHENNVWNNKKGNNCYSPFRDWKMKIKGLKPKATELELKPKCFPLTPKFLNLKKHHQQQNKTQSSLI